MKEQMQYRITEQFNNIVNEQMSRVGDPQSTTDRRRTTTTVRLLNINTGDDDHLYCKGTTTDDNSDGSREKVNI